MLAAILRSQLKEPLIESLDSFERQVKAYEEDPRRDPRCDGHRSDRKLRGGAAPRSQR